MSNKENKQSRSNFLNKPGFVGDVLMAGFLEISLLYTAHNNGIAFNDLLETMLLIPPSVSTARIVGLKIGKLFQIEKVDEETLALYKKTLLELRRRNK